MENKLSKPERELLKAIYRLATNNEGAHTSEIAAKLGVTAGTVTSGIKRLAERNLVVHRPYRGVELTETGIKQAVAVVRRHRIVERFLSDKLNYSWQDADRLAPKFEHHIPAEVEDRMFEVLNRPETCPHGYPIPERESTHVEEPLRLTDMHPGDEAVVALPGDMDADVVEFLDNMGMRPGVVIELRERQPFNGPVVVNVNGDNQTVGESLASRIRVLRRDQDDKDLNEN